MSWSRKKFLEILNTSIAEKLFSDSEISQYIAAFSDENKAALLHANGILDSSEEHEVKPMLQLIAAFGRKEAARMDALLNKQHVSAGVRLDYFLPLYSEKNDGGEDVFVASVKMMLNGDVDRDVKLSSGSMAHQVGDNIGSQYSAVELHFLEGYVNNSFEIRQLLRNAPNKNVVLPTLQALEYILNKGASYRDSNNNPVIVFIPGAIDIPDYTVPSMLEHLVKNKHGTKNPYLLSIQDTKEKANISDTGFFAVQGIVWSIILGDVESVNTFIKLGADLTMEDEMGNQHVAAWAASTYAVVRDNPAYCDRLLIITANLLHACQKINHANNMGREPLDYLDEQARVKIAIPKKLEIAF